MLDNLIGRKKLPLRPLQQACNQKVLTATQHLFTLCWFLWQQVHSDFWPIEWKVINSSSLKFSIVLLYLQPSQTINQYLAHRIHPPSMKLRIWIFPNILQVENILEGSLDLIPSPSVKIQIMSRKVCLRWKGKPLVSIVNKLLKTKICYHHLAMFCSITTNNLSLQ